MTSPISERTGSALESSVIQVQRSYMKVAYRDEYFYMAIFPKYDGYETVHVLKSKLRERAVRKTN